MSRAKEKNIMSTTSVSLQKIVAEAVNEKHMSLNEIANTSGLSITTVIRIYNGEANALHLKTVRHLAEALGYAVRQESGKGFKLEKGNGNVQRRRLTNAQKQRIINVVTRVLQAELNKL
jgi:transcriptional regulator with XRE-family HTH domain